MHPFFIYFLILTSILVVYYIITILKDKVGAKSKKSEDEEEFIIPSGKEAIKVEEDNTESGFRIQSNIEDETIDVTPPTPSSSMSENRPVAQPASDYSGPSTTASDPEMPLIIDQEESKDIEKIGYEKAAAMQEGLDPIDINSSGAIFEDDFDKILSTHNAYTPKPIINRTEE